eukprot:4564345-Alexandrium_andersonii.AAC.1
MRGSQQAGGRRQPAHSRKYLRHELYMSPHEFVPSTAVAVGSEQVQRGIMDRHNTHRRADKR